MDVCGLQHILDSASCYRTVSIIGDHKNRPECSLPSTYPNSAKRALSIITYTIWIKLSIV